MMQDAQSEQIALTIQQPWAELILRGTKTVEVRSVPVGMRTTIYLYTSKKLSLIPAASVAMQGCGVNIEELPRGNIVGTVEIVDCQPCVREDAPAACVPWGLMQGQYSWRLANPQRCQPPVKTPYVPYGMWFYPFKAKSTNSKNRN